MLTLITVVSGHLSMASFKDTELAERTHPPVVVNCQTPNCEVFYDAVYQFGQSQCVNTERRCCVEEDAKVCC